MVLRFKRFLSCVFLFDILIEGLSGEYRAYLQDLTHIDELNIFDILREKAVLAEKAEEPENGN